MILNSAMVTIIGVSYIAHPMSVVEVDDHSITIYAVNQATHDYILDLIDGSDYIDRSYVFTSAGYHIYIREEAFSDDSRIREEAFANES